MARFFGLYIEAPAPGSSIPNIGIGSGPRQVPAAPRPRIASEPAGAGPVGQGTRATVPMGHLGGPKIPPTATQSGGNESIPNTEHTVTQERGWPANPALNILPTPGARESQTRTDSELQTQPAPGRVLRQLFARALGNIGESGHQFPVDAGYSFIPHQNVPRTPMLTGPMLRQYDDNAPIPAVYAGNVRR